MRIVSGETLRQRNRENRTSLLARRTYTQSSTQSMHTSSVDNGLPLLEAVISDSSQTQVSCSECPHTSPSTLLLHEHIQRSHNDLHSQMLGNGQIPSAACRQETSENLPACFLTSKKQGDTDELTSHSGTEMLASNKQGNTVEFTSHIGTETETLASKKEGDTGDRQGRA